MSNHKPSRVAISALVKRVRGAAVKHGGTDEGLAVKMSVPVAALKATEELEATDEQVAQVAAALQRMAAMIETAMTEKPEETDAALKSVFGGGESGRMDISRDADGKRVKPSLLPEENRDAAGRSIKKVYS